MNPPSPPVDLLVVGAGPAGLMAAITAAQSGRKVIVLEYLPSPGRKLLASGAGKCNLTNCLHPEELARRCCAGDRYLLPALRELPPTALRRWFAAAGVPTVVTDGFHVFPASQRAGDVLNALLRTAKELGVTIRPSTPAKQLWIENGQLRGVTDGLREWRTTCIVLATGGKGYPALGGLGSGYELARQAGHSITEPVPALVGVQLAESWPMTLSGIVLPSSEVQLDRKHISAGELLFTHTGLSGPAVLDLSGTINTILCRTQTPVPITVNLLSEETAESWKNRLLLQQRTEGKKQLRTLLYGRLPQALVEQLLLAAALPRERRAAELTGAERERLIRHLTALPLTVTGNDGWNKAMATQGGIPFQELKAASLESKLLAGLFFAGEMIDVGAPCGGYNLQWAFSSGRLAGRHAALKR